MIVILCIGIPLFGKITISIPRLLKLIGCIYLMIVSYCSIFTFLMMLISNKAITAIISVVLAFGMLICALINLSVLSESEYIHTADIINMETSEFVYKEVPNPKYPSEQKKKVHQTLLDINPAGQAFQIVGRTVPNLNILPIYSLGIIILFTSFGIRLFKKKELK